MDLFFAVSLLVWGLFLLRARKGIAHLKSLDNFSSVERSPDKGISVVIAVKDDESEIEDTLHQLLKNKLNDFELVVVNDRSQDSTGLILDRLATSDERLKVVHISELPKGWLGKVHALHQAVKIASKDYILFMDADMGTVDAILSSSIDIMEAWQLDHLAILPNIKQKSYWLDLLMATSNILFTLSARPWLSIENKPIFCVKGVGKFNLVRRTTFLKTEGFEWLRMEVADDVALGQLIAKNNGRSMFLKAGKNGPDLSWYPTFWSMVKGLEKNSVGGFTNYKWSMLFIMVSSSILPVILFVTALLTGSSLSVFAFLTMTFFFASSAKNIIHYPWKVLAAFPLGIFILACVLVRAFIICWNNGGIKWSGTLYSLKELKQGCRVRLGL